MSGDGSCMLTWAGEYRRFRLAIGQLRELQESINRNRPVPVGPWTLYQMISRGDAWPDDLREVIRLGLLGGGTPSHMVPGLVKRYVEERPLFESVPTAQAVLGCALLGDVTDQVGKKTEAETQATSSSSQSSTEPAQQSDSLRNTSTNAHFGNSQHASKDTTVPTVANPIPTQ